MSSIPIAPPTPCRDICALLVALALGLGGLAPAAGAPVGLAEGLVNQEIPGSLGLPKIPAAHQTLYDSTDKEFHFSHHPNLVVYQDRLYAMWSSGLRSEDENGQRILWTNSADGGSWAAPSVLIADPDGDAGRLNAVAAGFHVQGRRLVAYYTATTVTSRHIWNKRPDEPDPCVYAIASDDTEHWSKPQKIVEGFFIDSPRRLPSGRLLMNGQYPSMAIRLIYTDSPDGLTGWKDAAVPPLPDVKPGFPEPNWFFRKDGTLVMLFRATNEQPWLYASESTNQGSSWSAPVRTNIPSATSRMAVGNLPDGRAYCIWNPSQKFGRVPLVIALSDDGVTFNHAYVLRGEPAKQKFVGTAKADGWQYPSVAVWRGSLWVVYSVNKEDVSISRVKLSDLR
ncbi:MAG: hypothetical protein EXS38_02205 [Opitutus sp.]|nr:hypothetical protein [Opitutus sp.]